jgi:hypothetical protein
MLRSAPSPTRVAGKMLAPNDERHDGWTLNL